MKLHHHAPVAPVWLALLGVVALLVTSPLGMAGCGASSPGGGATPGGAKADGGPRVVDPDLDQDGDGYTPNMGDCNDGNLNQHPGAVETCNTIDDDCNGRADEVCDWDGDNFTPDTGDCNDQEKLVNPGAYEVVGNDVDDNCDGMVDELPEACDTGKDRGAVTLAGAMDLCSPWVVKSQVNADADPLGRGVFANYGLTYKPKAGRTFGVLSTGIAGDESDPGYMEPQPGTEFANDHLNPATMNTKNNICGMSYSDEVTVHDYVELKYTLRVPTNAQSFSFQFNFMSSEYPEWVGSEFNDKFLALLDSKAFKGNISFDKNKNPITVNVGFFAVCDSAPICDGQKTNTCKVPVKDLAGTGYELDDGTGIPQGGGTGWLTTTSPVVPGETITLQFIIFDEGDHILDSAVIIDNFQWQLTPASGPTTIQ